MTDERRGTPASVSLDVIAVEVRVDDDSDWQRRHGPQRLLQLGDHGSVHVVDEQDAVRSDGRRDVAAAEAVDAVGHVDRSACLLESNGDAIEAVALRAGGYASESAHDRQRNALPNFIVETFDAELTRRESASFGANQHRNGKIGCSGHAVVSR